MNFLQHFRRYPPLALAVALLLAACNGKLEKPPLEVMQRESLLGAGQIIQIKSLTSEDLVEVEITVKTEDREVRHTELHLGAYRTVEVGWKKLGGWEVPADAQIEVRAKGYLLPVRARLAPAESEAHGQQ